MANPSITFWQRLEPRPRSNDFGPSLAAQVRDPAWFLCRQWQTGELSGQDAGSPAFISLATTTSTMTSFSTGGAPTTIDPNTPLERQVLAEPFSPLDLSLSVEIGQTFLALLVGQVSNTTYQSFVTTYPLEVPTTDPFNPLDTASAAFLTVCAGQTLDGATLYAVAKTGTVPPFVAQGDVTAVAAVFKSLVTWVQSVWGDLVADQDPPAWVPDRLEYRLQVQAEAPDGTGVGLDAFPDEDGELPWSAFDVSPTSVGAPGVAPVSTQTTLVPGNVRFHGIASPRFWDFEMSDLALPDVKPDPRDITKTLTLDFLLIHGSDWFIAPVTQALGTLTRVDALVVTDVFGAQTSITRADAGNTAPGPARWTLFSTATPTGLTNYFVSSPTAGGFTRTGRPIEIVRFARDEFANMAWGIQNAVPSPIGRGRPGPERSAAVDATNPVAPPQSTDKTSPLRYQVETEVPIHWTPLLGVPLPGVNNQVNELAVAAMLRPQTDALGNVSFVPIEPLGRILNPTGSVVGGINTYQIQDNEVPRAGLVVERVAFRTRWIDGSTHLWLARRRRTGSGETASALRFDVAQAANT